MPNHITNRVHLFGDAEKIRELLETVRYDDGEIGTLDFNRLIPMPEELDIAYGSSLGLADFDLLVGGFPCQSFSVAGKKRGIEDERGTLFFELTRILEAKRPQYFLFENVPGLLGIEKGRIFHKILTTLSELGYCVEWLVHDSAGFGVPQTRSPAKKSQ